MKKTLVSLGIFLSLSTASQSAELVHQFNSPSFSGVGYSSHALTIYGQELSRKLAIAAEKKADALKEGIRISKDLIQTENTRLETVKASNERIQQSIESLERKQRLWITTKDESIVKLEKSIKTLSTIDIDSEIVKQAQSRKK